MNKRAKIRRFLLGGLPPREQAEWEDRYFGSDGAFEDLVSGENDLIDSYVRGRLSPGEREQFEKRYCDSPGHIGRVKFAGALLQVRRSGPGAALRRPARLSLAWAVAAAVAIVGGVTWLAIQNPWLPGRSQSAGFQRKGPRPPGPELQPNGVPVHQTDNRTTASTVAKEKPPGIESPVAVLTLTPDVFRSAGTSQKTVAVDSRKSWVEMRLAIEADYPRYAAELQTVEGRTITHIGDSGIRTRAGEETVVLRVPAALLYPGDYVLKLNGLGKDGKPGAAEFYSFRVLR